MIIKSIVLKTASRCNLNCSYCYIYNKGDLSYQKQPKFLSKKLATKLLERVLSHMISNDLNTFVIVFHGGEPMLYGLQDYEFFINEYKRIFVHNPEKRIEFSMQTNGTLLTEENVTILTDLGIKIGVSMDSTKESNDNNRVYHNHRSSYDEILSGVKIVSRVTGSSGILSVIDVAYSPEKSYDHIKQTQVQFMDLLLPDETYDSIKEYDIRGKLGEWLCEMFDLWFHDKGTKPNIRFFHAMIQVILGMGVGFDPFGKNYGDTIVVESNGDIQTNDGLRSCKNGITITNLNILFNELAEIKNNPLGNLYINNHFSLSYICSKCPLESVCSGGYLVNRYSSKNGFDNESVFCKDMIKFISHVQNTLVKLFKDNLDFEPMDSKEIIEYVDKLKKERIPKPELMSF
ncbi:radical SAM protein [Sphingobacterium sp.]|uniref:radical SAM protein n=1 Tax=Sphingobacterium sp. TaxID=341027 RepID=UPI002FDE39F4